MAPVAEGKVRLKYVGASHYREIFAKDFKSVGVEDQEGIKVANESAVVVAHDWKTPQVAEISEDAADFLLSSEPDDWEETDEEPAPPAKARATAQRLARAQAREAKAKEGMTEPQTEDNSAGGAGTDVGNGASTANTRSIGETRRGSGRASTRSR
jgi:hypothetical protein